MKRLKLRKRLLNVRKKNVYQNKKSQKILSNTRNKQKIFYQNEKSRKGLSNTRYKQKGLGYQIQEIN